MSHLMIYFHIVVFYFSTQPYLYHHYLPLIHLLIHENLSKQLNFHMNQEMYVHFLVEFNLLINVYYHNMLQLYFYLSEEEVEVIKEAIDHVDHPKRNVSI
jgi:hypothetical protein